MTLPMYARLSTVTTLFMISLCVTAQIGSILDNLEDGHQVCAKDFEEDETMADFRNAFPDAANEADNDGIKRYEINTLNPESTSMYVNVTEMPKQAELLSVGALFMIALCVTAQTESAPDSLEDEQHVCVKDSEKNETMADFRNAFPDVATEVETYLGLLLKDDDGIRRYEIDSLNPEWTSMYVNVIEKASGKNHFLCLDQFASNLWSAHEINEEDFKKWKTACHV